MFHVGRDLYRCESPYEFPEVTDGFFSGSGKNEKKPAAPCNPQPAKPEPATKKCEPPKPAPDKKACEPKIPCPPESSTKKPNTGGCPRRRQRLSNRLPRSRNPFIIFFLSLYYKQPERRVTQVARVAGKEWCRMPDNRKELYRKLARVEQKRRQRGRTRCKSAKHRRQRKTKC